MTKNIKRHLVVYIAIAIVGWTILIPEFAGRVEANDNGGFFFILEGRGSLSEGDSTVWAEEAIFTTIVTPTGRVASIDTDFSRWSGRLGLGYQNGNWDIGIFYSGLQVLDDDEVFEPASNAAINLLGSFGIGVGGDTLITASSSVTYTVLDIEAGVKVTLGPVDARFFGGVRYFEIDQDIITSFNFFPIKSSDEHRDADFWGAGLRLGASASSPIIGSIGVTGSISGAALFGEQDTVTLGVVRDRQNDFRVAGNVEAELGMTYTRDMANASSILFTLGYRGEAWLDVNNTLGSPLPNITKIHGTTHADQIFHGPFLRGEWRFD